MKNPCGNNCIIVANCSFPCDKKTDYILYLRDQREKYSLNKKLRKQYSKLREENRNEIIRIFTRRAIPQGGRR